jgi:naphthalene 1,2-dioxygenase system ferredoxin subunit
MPTWTDALPDHALGPDDLRPVEIDGHEIVLYRVDGEVFATDNQCTHGTAQLCEGFLLGHEIECPLHQGRFDVRTGQPTAEPACAPLRCWPAKVEGGRIWLQLRDTDAP